MGVARRVAVMRRTVTGEAAMIGVFIVPPHRTIGVEHRRNIQPVAIDDLPPLKWSSLRYDFHQEDMINGKEAAYI